MADRDPPGCLPALILCALAYWGWSSYEDHQKAHAAQVEELDADAADADARGDEALAKVASRDSEISSLQSRLSEAEAENARLKQEIERLQSEGAR